MRLVSAGTVLGAILIALAILAPFLPAFERPGISMDEGSLLVYPELILKGHLPYRDFETFYAPGNCYLLAATYKVFGANINIERSVGFAYRVLILGAIFCLSSRWNVWIGAGCCFVAGILLLPHGVVAIAWMGAVACTFWGLHLTSRPDERHRCFFGGMITGLALLFRQDFAPALALSTLPLF